MSRPRQKIITPYNQEQFLSELFLIDQALAERSLEHYIKQAWEIVEPKNPLIWNWHLTAICEHLEAVTRGEIHYLIINIPPRHTKLIKDNQPILTPRGWRKHGDLKVGDYVFGSDGKPTRIIEISGKGIADYEVEFYNGEMIKCNGEHLWTVYDRSSRKWITRETKSLLSSRFKSGNTRARFQLPLSVQCKFKKKKQPLDPYFLGLWLGDGSYKAPRITHNSKVIKPILKKLKKRGIKPSNILDNKQGFSKNSNSKHYYFSYQGVLEELRKLNLIKNKHIPKIYKYASIRQRKEILAGLIDTDGCCDGYRIRIGTIHKRLAKDIYDIALSLGYRPYIMINDNPPNTDNIYYSIGFNVTSKLPIVKKYKRPVGFPVVRRIGIKEVRIAKRPEVGHCIIIENKDGLYHVGKKNILTHNSLTASVFWPTWEWGPKDYPHRRHIWSSYAQSLSTRDSLKSRRLIQSAWYQERWGDRFKITSDQNQKMRFDNSKGGYRVATSVEGIGTGEGGDVLGSDDPHNVNKVESDVQRENVVTWWDETMSTRLDNEKTGAYVIIMQRSHHNDLTGHLIEKHKGGEIRNLVTLILPARYEKERDLHLQTKTPLSFKDPRTKEGQVLDKGRYPDEVLKDLESRMTEYARAGQLQQRPNPRGGGMFKVENFKIISQSPPKRFILKSVRYWDKAATEGGGSLTAGVLMYQMRKDWVGPKFIIEDVVSGQWSAGVRNERIKQTAALDGVSVYVYTEQEPGSGGKESAEGTVKDLAGFRVEADRVTGSKEIRAENYASQVEVQNVALVRGDWNKEFLDQHEFFPTGSRKKDMVDASSGSFNKLNFGIQKRAGVWGR